MPGDILKRNALAQPQAPRALAALSAVPWASQQGWRDDPDGPGESHRQVKQRAGSGRRAEAAGDDRAAASGQRAGVRRRGVGLEPAPSDGP